MILLRKYFCRDVVELILDFYYQDYKLRYNKTIRQLQSLFDGYEYSEIEETDICVYQTWVRVIKKVPALVPISKIIKKGKKGKYNYTYQ